MKRIGRSSCNRHGWQHDALSKADSSRSPSMDMWLTLQQQQDLFAFGSVVQPLPHCLRTDNDRSRMQSRMIDLTAHENARRP